MDMDSTLSDRERLAAAALCCTHETRLRRLETAPRAIEPSSIHTPDEADDLVSSFLRLSTEEQAARLTDMHIRSALAGVHPGLITTWDQYGLPRHFQEPPVDLLDDCLGETLTLYTLAAAYTPLMEWIIKLLDDRDQLALRATSRLLCVSVDQQLVRHLTIGLDGVRGTCQGRLPRSNLIEHAYLASHVEILTLPLPQGWRYSSPPSPPFIPPRVAPRIVRTHHTLEETFVPGTPDIVVAFSNVCPGTTDEWLTPQPAVYLPKVRDGVREVVWNVIFGAPTHLDAPLCGLNNWILPDSVSTFVFRLVQAKPGTLPPKPISAVGKFITPFGDGQRLFRGTYYPFPDRGLDDDEQVVAVPDNIWTDLPPGCALILDQILFALTYQLVEEREVIIVGAEKWRPEWLCSEAGGGRMQDRVKATLAKRIAQFLECLRDDADEHVEAYVSFMTEKRFRKSRGLTEYRLATVEEM